MSIRPCEQCIRFSTCEHPEKAMDAPPVVSCELFRDADTDDRVCINCVKYGGNCVDSRGTTRWAQYCGSYEEIRCNREVWPPTGRMSGPTDPPLQMLPRQGRRWPRYLSGTDLRELMTLQAELNRKAGFDCEDLKVPGGLDLKEAGK